MAEQLDKKTFEKLVDEVLKSNGTPRRELFEYPYNEFESRALIKKAEATVHKMLGILGFPRALKSD